jgi:hypothetical protein
VLESEVLEVTKTIGSLALAYPYLRRLGVAETIDGLVTAGKERAVPTGQVIEVLILNRLSLRPVPISNIGAWAQTQAIEEVYGLAADVLNDDRIGRALDEIHPHLVDLWAALILRGVTAYRLRLDQVHSDVTRVAFEGAYDDVPSTTAAGQPVARITHGFKGKEDPSRKQVTLSLSVAADGAIPAWYRLAEGNAADTRAYLAHLAALRAALHLERPLVIGDSKLITRANQLGFCRVGAHFIGPTSLTEADRAAVRAHWAAARRGTGWIPRRRGGRRPPGATGAWSRATPWWIPSARARMTCGVCSCRVWMIAGRHGINAPRTWPGRAGRSGRSSTAWAARPSATSPRSSAKSRRPSPACARSCRSPSPPRPGAWTCAGTCTTRSCGSRRSSMVSIAC